MKNQESFDNFITQTIKEATNKDIDVPDMNDVWKNIEHHVKNKKKMSKKFIGGAIAATIILASGNIIFMNDGYANYFRTLKTFFKENDNIAIVQIDNKTPGEKSDLFGEVSEEDIVIFENGFIEYSLPLELAKNISNLPIKEPTYIPEGYQIDKVKMLTYKEKTFNVLLIYTSSHQDNYIEITFEAITGETVLSLNINPSAGNIREKLVDGYKYNIIEYKQGYNEILWDIDEIKYTLRSNISTETSLKIASSFRKK